MSLPSILRVKKLAQTRLFRIEGVDLEFSNGTQCQFERINNQNAGAVMVLPILGDELVMIREYAVGSERYELGFVKGLIDEGESPEAAANRELKEEIGFGAKRVEVVRKTHLLPHYNTAVGYVVLARELYPDAQTGDEPEAMEQVRWPLSDLHALLQNDEISDVRTLYALYWLQGFLQNASS